MRSLMSQRNPGIVYRALADLLMEVLLDFVNVIACCPDARSAGASSTKEKIRYMKRGRLGSIIASARKCGLVVSAAEASPLGRT